MKPFILILAGAAAALSASALAGPPANRQDIVASLDRDGAKATVARLFKTGAWDDLADHIGRGEAAWIDLAPKLAAGTDAGTSEDLGVSLAYALPKNPAATLRVVKGGVFPIRVERVCSIPFIEPTAAFVKDYRAQALAAVAKVDDPALADVKRACLSQLRR